MTSEQTPATRRAAPPAAARLEDRLLRDLVAAYPETMTVLGPLGIDLCCGGGHPLGEALDQHGLERETILPRIARVIAGSGGAA